MTIPDVVKCPICGDIMNRIKDVRTDLISKSTEFDEGEKEVIHSKVFKCPSCFNTQYFLESY